MILSRCRQTLQTTIDRRDRCMSLCFRDVKDREAADSSLSGDGLSFLFNIFRTFMSDDAGSVRRGRSLLCEDNEVRALEGEHSMAKCEHFNLKSNNPDQCTRRAIWKVLDQHLCSHHAYPKPLELVRGDWVKYGKWVEVEASKTNIFCRDAIKGGCTGKIACLTIDGIPFCKNHAEHFVFEKAQIDPIFSKVLEIEICVKMTPERFDSPSFDFHG
jgi:hypothetical protein